MKFMLNKLGFNIPVNNEEYELLETIFPLGKISKGKLDERQQELARLMTSRGLLERFKIDESLYYRPLVFKDSEKGLQILSQAEEIRSLINKIDKIEK